MVARSWRDRRAHVPSRTQPGDQGGRQESTCPTDTDEARLPAPQQAGFIGLVPHVSESGDRRTGRW